MLGEAPAPPAASGGCARHPSRLLTWLHYRDSNAAQCRCCRSLNEERRDSKKHRGHPHKGIRRLPFCFDLIPVSLCSQRKKKKEKLHLKTPERPSPLPVALVRGVTESRERKQGSELISPTRAVTRSSPGATRDVFLPPSPTSGSPVCPRRLRCFPAPQHN